MYLLLGFSVHTILTFSYIFTVLSQLLKIWLAYIIPGRPQKYKFGWMNSLWKLWKGQEFQNMQHSYTIKSCDLVECEGFCGYNWLEEISVKTVRSDWGKESSISKNDIGKGRAVSQSLGQSWVCWSCQCKGKFVTLVVVTHRTVLNKATLHLKGWVFVNLSFSLGF